MLQTISKLTMLNTKSKALFHTLLKTLTFDEGLNAFRSSKEQYDALLEITTLSEGRVYVIRLEQHIIGYVTYHYPDELERWSTGHLPIY